MEESVKDLSKIFDSLLKDNIYMCQQSIEKCNKILESCTNADLITIVGIHTNTKKMLKRMEINLSEFSKTLENAESTYKNILEVSPQSPTNTTIANPNKTGESEDETATEQGTSHSPHKEIAEFIDRMNKNLNAFVQQFNGAVEEYNSGINSHKKKIRLSLIKEEDRTPLKTEVASELTVSSSQLIEIPGVESEKQTETGGGEAEALPSVGPIEEVKSFSVYETMSFDFDEENLEVRPYEQCASSPAKITKEEQNDLLKLLDEYEVKQNITEKDADEALANMDDLVSSDSENLNESILSDEIDDSSDESNLPKPQIQLKELRIKLKRIEEDSSIGYLCNLDNLLKRKSSTSSKTDDHIQKRKRKRILSTSSTFSDNTSLGSITPELEVSPTCPARDDNHQEDELADAMLRALDNSDTEGGSASETDVEENSIAPEKQATKMKQENVTKSDKRQLSEWELNPLLRNKLWSDSEEESESEELEPTVISSESDSDDDVEFVCKEENGGPGRRNIRSILSDDELALETQKAKYEEEERIQRLEMHSKTVQMVRSQREAFVLDADPTTGEPLVTVDPQLASRLKPHQRNGVQFMWDACFESIEMVNTGPGTGCILAHCMGLGKSFQVITLLHTLFTHKITKINRALIVCPLSTVNNWKNEFKLAFDELREEPKINLFFLVKEDFYGKLRILNHWRNDSGVMVMGYDAFIVLTKENHRNSTNIVKLKEILLDPGPDLVICDEGHLLKNAKTNRSNTMMSIKTKRRIVLTGTPMQNNLIEYYHMVKFVKPFILGTLAEYKNRFYYPIMNGQYYNSQVADIKLMKKRTHVLTQLLEKTIDRVETSVLAEYLPKLTYYTIFVKLTPLQVVMYENYIKLVKSRGLYIKSYFRDARVTKLFCFHPYTLYLHREKQDKLKKKKKINKDLQQQTVNEIDVNDNEMKDWYKDLMPDDIKENVDYSTKLKILLDIVRETIKRNEKILIFSHNLADLDCVEFFLKNVDSFPWTKNMNYYRMDGNIDPNERTCMCKEFNTHHNIKLFLITHKSGGLGLNLTGANRVILIGASENPAHDVQSIYRTYRFGQTKECFVYQLLSLGTMEEKVYQRCVVKLAVSGTVVDRLHFDRHFKSTSLEEMYKYDFDQYSNERPIPVVPNDDLLATLLAQSNNIHKYLIHDALLENRPEEELTDEEKQLAWQEYHNARAIPQNNTQIINVDPTNPVDTQSSADTSEQPVDLRVNPVVIIRKINGSGVSLYENNRSITGQRRDRSISNENQRAIVTSSPSTSRVYAIQNESNRVVPVPKAAGTTGTMGKSSSTISTLVKRPLSNTSRNDRVVIVPVPLKNGTNVPASRSMRNSSNNIRATGKPHQVMSTLSRNDRSSQAGTSKNSTGIPDIDRNPGLLDIYQNKINRILKSNRSNRADPSFSVIEIDDDEPAEFNYALNKLV